SASIGSLSAGDYVLLRVADTGTGIPPEAIDRIFDPFFTTKDVGVGTGLGLSLVHGIVTSLDGAIDVETSPGAGPSFSVYLPRSAKAVAADGQPKNVRPAASRGEGQRILVVDDEDALVRLTTERLSDLGYVATGFTSSISALAVFEASPDQFDAI